MKKEFDEANSDVNVTYKKLTQIADSIISEATNEVDTIISIIHERSEKLTDKDINRYMLELGCLDYDLGVLMEHSNLRSECAKAIEKERQAEEFVIAVGSNDVKRSHSTLETLNESAVSLLYSMVASMLKTKLNESHRVVDILKSIQISRNAEAKRNTDNTEVE